MNAVIMHNYIDIAISIDTATYTGILTNSSISFVIPFQENLSVTRARVFLNPKCPEVTSVWQDLTILCCSSSSFMYLTRIFSYNAKTPW